MSMWSWLYPDRTEKIAPLIPVDERGTGPSPCCAHLEQRLREVDEARATYFAQACDLADRLAEAEACIAELTAALDQDRPAPDRTELAADLRRSYWRALGHDNPLDTVELERSGWAAAADTAIDTCRGLRTTTEQPEAAGDVVHALVHDFHCDGDAPCSCEVAYLAVALNVSSWLHPRGWDGWLRVARLAVEIVRDLRIGEQPPADAPAISGGESPGSGEAALDLASRLAVDAALMDAVAVRVPTGATSPDPAPGGPPRHFLRRLIEEAMDNAARNPDTWPRMLDFVEAKFTDALTAWWPVTPARPDQRPVIAAILTAHDVLEDGTCRCGWLGERIYHAEHVAEIVLESLL